MRDAERHAPHPDLLRNLCRLTRYRQCRPSARFAHYFQIHPFHAAPPARSQRLHRRFFCREPPRVALIFILKPLAVLALPRRVDSPQKHFPMPLDRPLDALHFCNVHAHANDQDASIAPLFGPAADSDYTGRLVASTKTVTARHSARKPGVSFSAGTPWTERSTRGIRILQVPTLTKFSWIFNVFST